MHLLCINEANSGHTGVTNSVTVALLSYQKWFQCFVVIGVEGEMLSRYRDFFMGRGDVWYLRTR